jgi:hypothetical protein
VEHDVDDEPVVEESELCHRHVEQGADRAVGTIAPHRVTGLDDLAVGGRKGDDARVLAEVGDRAAATDLDTEVPGAALEDRLERGLVEHQRQRPSRGARSRPAQPEQGRPVAVAPLVDVGRFRDRFELGTDAGRLEDARHLVIDVDRPRQGIRVRPTFEHRHRVAPLREQHRQGQSDGTAADHGHIRVSPAHAWRSG